MSPHPKEDDIPAHDPLDDAFAHKSQEGQEATEEGEQTGEQDKLATAPAPAASRGKCVRFGGEQKMPETTTPSANIIQNLAPHLPGMDPNSVYIVSGPFTYFDPQQNSYTGMLVAQPVPQGASVVAVPCGAPPSPSGEIFPGKPCPLPAAWTQHDGKPFKNLQAPHQYSATPIPVQMGAPGQLQVVPTSPPVPGPNVLMNTAPQASPNAQHTAQPVASTGQQPGYPQHAPNTPQPGYPQQAPSSPHQPGAPSTSPGGRLNPTGNGATGPKLGAPHSTVNGHPGTQPPLAMAGSPNQMENGLTSSQHQLAVQAMANNQHKMVVMNQQQPMNGQQMLINGLQPQGRKEQYSASVNPPDPQFQPVDQAQPHDSDSSAHHCPPSTTSSHYQATQQQPSYRRQNLQAVNNNNNNIVNNNNNKPPGNTKPKPAPVWRNCAQQNMTPNSTLHQFQNGQFLPGQTHVVNGPLPPVNGHYPMNGHFPVMNGFNGHIQQVNGLNGQPVNMPQVSLPQQNCLAVPQTHLPQAPLNVAPQAGYGATLHMGGGQFATGSPAMRIPVTNLGGGCPIHQPNMPQAPHIMHWDANHLSGHPVPLRQPNPPVYYNVPAPSTQGANNQQNQSQVQDSGSGSQSPSSDMSAQTGSGGSDASSEESATVDMSRQQSVQYVQGGYGNGYPVQCVVHYGSPAIHSKEVYDIHGRKIHNFEQHFSNRNMQVH